MLVSFSSLFHVVSESLSEVQQQGVTLQEHTVARASHHLGNLKGSLNSSEFKESRGSGHSISKKFGSFCFSRSLDNDRLLILKGLINKILGTLSLLLGDLFVFDSLGELGSEMKVSDGHIIENNKEVSESVVETLSNSCGHLFSLGQKLVGVVTGNYGLEHFVHNRGEDSSVVVPSVLSVNVVKLSGVRSKQHSQAEVNHLQVLRSGDTLDDTRVSTHVVDYGSLEPGHLKVVSFSVDRVFHSIELVEFKGSVTRLNEENT